jgi:hypothetical protein
MNLPREAPEVEAGRRSRHAPVLLALLSLTCFAACVATHYFLVDDAFISFRYARNLIDGHGLVFNPGERVEGYTNFLWVLLMAACMKAGLSAEILSNVIGIASGTTILLVMAGLGARSGGWSDPWIWIAPMALAVNRTFGAWSTGGLETQFFALLVLAANVRYLGERRKEAPYPWGSALLFALAALTRPEGIMFFGAAAILFGIDTFLLRRRPLASFSVWAGIFGIIVATHMAWRHAYYGHLLPNTYYAKVSGLWIDQAAAYIDYFMGDHLMYSLLPLPVLLILWRREEVTILFVTILAAFTAYLLYIGGGHFEFRLMTFVLPYIFWLFQEAVREGVRRGWGIRLGRRGAAAIGMVVTLMIVVGSYFPHRLDYRDARRGVSRLESMRRYAARRTEEGRFLASLVEKGYLRGDELTAVTGAGALPYYSGLPVLDFFGLNDERIAHQEITERGRIAHEKKAPYAYLVERGVVLFDVRNRIVEPAGSSPPEARTVERDGIYSGPVHCVEAEGRYLVFATTLSDDEFRKRLERFRILF